MFRTAQRVSCLAVVAAATLSATVLAPTSAAAAAKAQPAQATAVTAGALPTPQTDGIVFSVAIVGDTVYAGGRFSKARPAGVAPGGQGEVARHNLMAFNVHTGALLPWAPAATSSTILSKDPGPYCTTLSASSWTCDSVFRIKASPDGSKVYVVGDFDKVDGSWRSRIARFDAVSGALDAKFAPQIAGRVRGLSITADTVYVGGAFSAVNGSARNRLAAVGVDGTLKPWAPSADKEVNALLAAQGRVIIGGGFNTINGEARRAMMAVDGTSGANVSWQAKAPDAGDVVTDIVTDGQGVAYLGSYNYQGAVRFEGRAAFDIGTGAAKWWDGCLGDTQALTVSKGVVYSASHTHDCSASNAIPEKGSATGYFRLVAETAAPVGTATANVNHVKAGDPIPEILPWFPNTNSGPANSFWKNGPWAIDSNADYVVVGGEFTTVNGKSQQSLTRFAARGVSSAVHNGPQYPFPAPVLSREGGVPTGSPVITWKGTWDAQNSDIRYEVMRVGSSTPIYTETKASRPWQIPSFTFVDRGTTSGTYWIRAVDADGAKIGSPQASI